MTGTTFFDVLFLNEIFFSLIEQFALIQYKIDTNGERWFSISQ